MSYFIRYFFVGLLFFLFAQKGAADCFIIKNLESNAIIKSEGNCEKRVPPCSTFKIPLAIIGFETGNLKNATTPIWNFKKEYENAYHVCIKKWKAPHNPSSWVKNSCIWYSQVLAQQLGIKKLQQYVNIFNYGNKDLSGDPGRNNGLTHAWLSSSLKISAREQIEFITKILQNKLPVTIASVDVTREILFVSQIAQFKLFGKTGSGYQLDSNGVYNKDKQLGWFVGWLEDSTKNKHYVFAYLLENENSEKAITGLRAKEKAIIKIKTVLDENSSG